MSYPKPIKYRVKNPHKYSGDLRNVICRSSWEYHFCKFCDLHPSVIVFGSEHTQTVIPYVSPIDNKVHSYYPDFIMKMRTAKGDTPTYLIEIKPHAETMPPKEPKRKTKSYKEALKVYAVNSAKWEAARKWCAARGVIFKILTEYDLHLKERKSPT